MNTQDISTASQRARLLTALKSTPGGITTIQARRDLNVMQPAPRIKELRERGCQIATIRETQTDDQGRKHPRCARYVYLGGGV
ncbi:helix-turn-helix domain-containing protein [Halothiobacillus sp.]|uniref:helix-turn-helix domain-containing protein n=1 Tax=Halothiobacillus sp. TaxID=1891311 RepID=UPI0034521FDC